MAKLRVGLVGCGFVAELHMYAYQRVYGTRGYLQEIQDFMECVALGRQPLADVGLAYETIKVNYAGYWSAEDGRRVAL